jgi:hypothetical protein
LLIQKVIEDNLGIEKHACCAVSFPRGHIRGKTKPTFRS